MTWDFDLEGAQDALARSDFGEDPQPGDQELIDAYEHLCQQEQLRFDDRCRMAEYAAWLAEQCPGCESGGTGEPCDEHGEDAE